MFKEFIRKGTKGDGRDGRENCSLKERLRIEKMFTSLKIFEDLSHYVRHGKRCALVTITAASGSTPRGVGSRMIVFETGEISGSIGGGLIEKDAAELAVEAIREKKTVSREFDLGDDGTGAGKMICGGKATVLIEPFDAGEKLIICGAGHIGQSLAKIADMLNFTTIIIDDRKEFANEKLFPTAGAIINPDSWGNALKDVKIDSSTYIVILTYKHLGDEICLRQAVGRGAKYVGMIGSRSKVGIVLEKLIKDGYNKEEVEAVHTPIGIKLGGQFPEEIAVSIAAELIQVRYDFAKQSVK